MDKYIYSWDLYFMDDIICIISFIIDSNDENQKKGVKQNAHGKKGEYSDIR